MRTIARSVLALSLLPYAAVLGACGDSLEATSACRNLVYKESGLSRAEYLPCAGEIMAALGELEAHTQAAFKGDSAARADGQAALRRVSSLMNAAGGRNLLERWDDKALTDLNIDINNAVSHYQAFYWVRIIEEPDPRAAKTRSAAEAEMLGASRNYEEARRTYRHLR